MTDLILHYFLLAIAVAAMSYTVAKAKITEPARFWVWCHSKWGGEALSCTYCMSHWIAFTVAFLYESTWANTFMVTFILVGMAAVINRFFPENPHGRQTEKGRQKEP